MDSRVNKDPTPRGDGDSSPEEPDTDSSPSGFQKGTDGSSLNAPARNPFKKTSQDDNWASNDASHEHKPILAPPKLRAPSEATGFLGSSSSSSSHSTSNMTTRPFGGGVSLFGAPSASASTAPSGGHKPGFKLKPSMLSGYGVSSSSNVTTSPPGGSDNAEGVDSTSSKESAAANPFSPTEAESDPVADTKSVPSGFVSSSSEMSSEPLTPRSDPEAAAPSRPESSSRERAPLPTVPSAAVSSSSSATGLRRPVFVPLNNGTEATSSEDSSAKVNGSAASSTSPLSSARMGTGFIFGQNVQTRVSGVEESSGSIFGGGAGATANGEMGTEPVNLFTVAATGLTQGPAAEDGGAWGGGKSLVESSMELSEKEASQKRKYEEVEIITGEESEKNVLQMMCKLYGWSMGSWQEKGRGHLRLNDRKINGDIHSRMVVRTQGTFTVMLNAKIWADMSVEKTNDKSVRFTASDADGQPKIFLVMGTPKDIDLLYTSLEYRVAASKSQKPIEGEEDEDEDERKKFKMDDPPLST